MHCRLDWQKNIMAKKREEEDGIWNVRDQVTNAGETPRIIKRVGGICRAYNYQSWGRHTPVLPY